MSRRGAFERKTQETGVAAEVVLEGTGAYDVQTPIGFLSHMVEQIARHSLVDLRVRATGDVHVDGHHLTEDLGITLGRAVAAALGDRTGIRRYGAATLPMDEACVTCAVDLGGRPFYVGRLELAKAKVGEFDSELTDVFFEGFARGASCNVHLHRLSGENLHHTIEVSFKAFARALRQAVELDPRAPDLLPTTKGTLTE